MRKSILFALSWLSFSMVHAEGPYAVYKLHLKDSPMAKEMEADCVLQYFSEFDSREECKEEMMANYDLDTELIGEAEKEGEEIDPNLLQILTENKTDYKMDHWPYACLSEHMVTVLEEQYNCF